MKCKSTWKEANYHIWAAPKRVIHVIRSVLPILPLKRYVYRFVVKKNEGSNVKIEFLLNLPNIQEN